MTTYISPHGSAYEIPYKIPSYKCILVGDSKVGKTAYVRRLTRNDSINYYEPTKFTHVSKVIFKTNTCDMRFDMYDTPSSGDINNVLRDMDCAIVMFDHSNEKSFQSVKKWIDTIHDIKQNIPIVVCGNECNAVNAIIQVSRMLDIANKKDSVDYCDISTHAKIDLYKPCQMLIEKMFKVPQITGFK
jgi:small GTP-binding protein